MENSKVLIHGEFNKNTKILYMQFMNSIQETYF